LHPVYWAYREMATASPILPYGRRQETHYALRYQGEWHTRESPDAELGRYRESHRLGDRLEFTFRGTGIDLVTRRGPEVGRVWVTIEGGPRLANRLPRDSSGRAYLDLAASSDEAHVQIPLASGLPYGDYKVVIEVASPGKAVAVDALVVYSGKSYLLHSGLAALLLVGALLSLLLARFSLDSTA